MTDRPTPDIALDAALTQWARADFTRLAGDEAALARILSHADAIPHPARAEAPAPRRWLPVAIGSGALAASIAVALLLNPMARPPAPSGPAPTTTPDQGVQLAIADDHAVESFALLYTVTDEEEQVL
jgi:hypothetical protein